MLRSARFAQLLVALAMGVGVCRSTAAEEYQNYPPPRPLAGWSDTPATAPQNAASKGPSAVPAHPPHFVPTRYATPDAPVNDASGSGPASSKTAAVASPLPLSRQSSDAPSPLGGLAGGTDSLVDAATSLGIVLGLFLLVAWAVKRGMPKGSGLLPSEAVEVLGRASLAGRQQVHLVRCGNKIVLLSVAASGTQTLAEISDPAEVDRLHSICQPGSPGGALRQFFGHFTGQARSTEYYTGDESQPIDFRHLETGGQRRA